MSFNAREIAASPSAVFAVLLDPQTYPRWLIGASSIRDVDDDWPAVGSRFHHLVGVKPLVLPDYTEILDVEPDTSLLLQVRARPLVKAEVRFRLVGRLGRCVVTIEEEPSLRVVGNIVRPLMDPMIHVRNHRSLRRLEAVVLEHSTTTAGSMP